MKSFCFICLFLVSSPTDKLQFANFLCLPRIVLCPSVSISLLSIDSFSYSNISSCCVLRIDKGQVWPRIELFQVRSRSMADSVVFGFKILLDLMLSHSFN